MYPQKFSIRQFYLGITNDFLFPDDRWKERRQEFE